MAGGGPQQSRKLSALLRRLLVSALPRHCCMVSATGSSSESESLLQRLVWLAWMNCMGFCTVDRTRFTYTRTNCVGGQVAVEQLVAFLPRLYLFRGISRIKPAQWFTNEPPMQILYGECKLCTASRCERPRTRE